MKSKSKILLLVLCFLFVLSGTIGGGICLFLKSENNQIVPPDAEVAPTATAPTNTDSWTDSGNYSTTVWSGAGTEANPYLIQNARDLARLSYVRSNGFSCVDVYFKQTADIDISAHYWTPINSFAGKYDGNGHTIDGLFISTSDTVGLFNAIGSKTNLAEIKNLTIGPNSKISCTWNSAAFIGYGRNFKLSNCVNYAYVASTGEGVGGFVGNCENDCIGIIENCINYAKIESSYRSVSGIIGCCHNSDATITDCQNYGYIVGSYYVGGIVGRVFEQKLKIKNCINSGEIYVAGNSDNNESVGGGIIGGCYGYPYAVFVENCTNYGFIKGKEYLGGIAGFFRGAIKSCQNYGYVADNYDYNCRGGIAAAIQKANVSYCVNYTKVIGRGDVGGIIGHSENSSIVDSFNKGLVSLRANGAGIAGYMRYTNIERCYNNGNIYGDATALGGIAGGINGAVQYNKNIIRNCYNTGNVNSAYNSTSTDSGCGGVAGFAGAFTYIFNCYNTGDVVARSAYNIGGISGKNYAEIRSCFNTGNMTGRSSSYTGGLVGYNSGVLEASYIVNTASCTSHIGYAGNNSVVGCYTMTPEEVKKQTWYNSGWSTSHPWNFNEFWGFIPGKNDGLPVLKTTYETFEDSEAEGYRNDNEITFTGSNYIALGRTYMYTDKFYFSCEAYMDDWSEYSTKNMKMVSCTQNGGWNIENFNVEVIGCSTYNGNVGYTDIYTDSKWSYLNAGWHKFELSFDGNYTRLYIDGRCEGQSNYFTSGRIGYHASNGLFLGAEAGESISTPDGGYFKGKMKNIRILHTSGLTEIYKDDAIALDANGGEFDVEGYKHNEEITFDGTNYIPVGRKYMYTDKIYVSVEAYMANWNQFTNMALISCTQFGGWNIVSESDSQLCFNIQDNSMKTLGTSIYNTNISAGWHKFEFSYDGAYARGYYDGKEVVKSFIDYGQIFYNRTNNIFIGGEANDDLTPAEQIFVGKIRNVQILHTAKEIPVEMYSEVGALKTPVREDFIFDGWWTEEVGGVQILSTTVWKTEYKTKTLYAHWIAKKYTVVYDANGGLGEMAHEVFEYNETKNLLSNIFTRTGYAFLGWADTKAKADTKSTDYIDGQSVTNINGKVSDFVVLYAVWSVHTFDVVFNGVGCSGTMTNQHFTYDTAQNLTQNNFTKVGHKFLGWATSQENANSGTVKYFDGEEVLNITATLDTVNLYTVWAPITYELSFVANGGEGVMADQEFTYGISKNISQNSFTRLGYKFAGWAKSLADASSGTVEYTDKQNVSNITINDNDTIILYAVWEKLFWAEYSVNGYWYVEVGMMPQSRVSQTMNLKLNQLKNTNSAELVLTDNAYKVSNSIVLSGYTYAGNEYCIYQNQWYNVEPIRWKLQGDYTTGQVVTSGTNAVLDTIVYMGAYSSGTTGYSASAVDAFASNFDGNKNYVENFEAFVPSGLSGYNDKIYIASESEIQSVAGSFDVKFSDLMCDIVGIRCYYTRTQANDGNMRVFSYLGTASASAPTYQHGIQFVVKVSNFTCV